VAKRVPRAQRASGTPRPAPDDHGARKTTDGRKQGVGPARQQQRTREQLDPSLEAAQPRVAKQAEALTGHQEPVAASESQGHGPRLAQRQRALVGVAKALQDAQHPHAKLPEHAAALGPPRERADRDCRTQTIMTCRPLLLENALRAFRGGLGEPLQTKGSLDWILRRLVERSGARSETVCQVVYWMNPAGVSLPSRRLLTEVVEGLCAMEVRDQGKPMRMCLKDLPP